MNRKTLLSLFALTCAALLVGCGSIERAHNRKLAQLPTSELLLRRQQIQYRLAQTAGQWSFGSPMHGGHDVIGERDDLLKEKEAIERELLRRREQGQR